MKEQFLQYAVCPSCRQRLRLGGSRVDGVGGEIRSGGLLCDSCRTTYRIQNYIPRFVSSNNYASSFGLEWMRHPRTQIDKFTGKTFSRDRFYRTTRWPERLVGRRILEAGCGAGRFTEIALNAGAELVSFDLSDAVDACLENHGLSPSWHLFQGDLHRMPLQDALFDGVFCFGVLQHCSDPQAAFEALLPALRAGGQLAVDVYGRSWEMYFTPRPWLRIIVRRMRPEVAYRLIARAVPKLIPVKKWLKRHFPGGGRYLAAMIPVVSYEDLLPLSAEQHIELAILDTFDALSAWYENRVGMRAVEMWLQRAGLTDTGVESVGRRAGCCIIARGTKPTGTPVPVSQMSAV